METFSRGGNSPIKNENQIGRISRTFPLIFNRFGLFSVSLSEFTARYRAPYNLNVGYRLKYRFQPAWSSISPPCSDFSRYFTRKSRLSRGCFYSCFARGRYEINSAAYCQRIGVERSRIPVRKILTPLRGSFGEVLSLVQRYHRRLRLIRSNFVLRRENLANELFAITSAPERFV